MDDKKSSGPLVLRATRELLFDIISLQGNALSPSLVKLSYPYKIEGFLSGPPSTCNSLLPLWRLHCFHTVYHKDGISVLETDRS